MAPRHIAMFSYTRVDDEFLGGAISALREQLELAGRVITGRDFEVFQDVDGIAWGNRWADRLDEALEQSFFLVSFLTPLFFASQYCRDELEKFLALERHRGDDSLIFPVYLISTPLLEDPALRSSDPLAMVISQRQWWDWRDKNLFPMDDTRMEIRELARGLAEAMAQQLAVRTQPPPQPVPLRERSAAANAKGVSFEAPAKVHDKSKRSQRITADSRLTLNEHRSSRMLEEV